MGQKDGALVLVLTRKQEEKILIGGNIEIMVLGIDGHKVRLGINAPREVEIVREEAAIERGYVGVNAKDAIH